MKKNKNVCYHENENRHFYSKRSVKMNISDDSVFDFRRYQNGCCWHNARTEMNGLSMKAETSITVILD